MEEIQVTARKWGDSIAVIIPSEIVNTKKIKPSDKIKITIKKGGDDLSFLWGKLKTKKTAQELKDESRSGWE